MGLGKETHGTLGPARGKAVGGPNNALQGEVTRRDASLNHDNRRTKRGQKTTSNEGSPMAKVRPCLVARDPRSEEISSQSLGSPVNPGLPGKEKKSKQLPGNWCDPTQDQNSDILKRVDKRMFHLHPGMWCGRINSNRQ